MLSPERCGILFDLDGVLVNSTEAHLASFVKLGEEVGYTMPREQFRGLFGRHNADIFPILFGHPLPAAQLAELAERKEAIFRDLLRGKVAALPGVRPLLMALRQVGFHLALGTSTPRANVDMILAELGIVALLEAIVSAEDVTRGKPDPQVFVMAAERLGVPPAHCVVVEDAVAGVEAAKGGGMLAIAVTTNHPREAFAAKADYVVESLAELSPMDFIALLSQVRE